MVLERYRDRPWLILSTQRSGSTWPYSILHRHLWETKRVEGLDEVFGQEQGTLVEEEGILKVRFCEPSDRPETTTKYSFAETRRRIKLLDKYYGQYVFKVFPGQIPTRWIKKFSRNYNVLAWERKDGFEHFLSFAVSYQTGRFYEPGGLSIPERSLPYDPTMIRKFSKVLTSYRHLKRQVNPRRTLYFEDFEPDFRSEKLLEALGLGSGISIDPERVSQRQNHGDKLDLFERPILLLRDWKRFRELNGDDAMSQGSTYFL